MHIQNIQIITIQKLEMGIEFWNKKNGQDRHWAGSGKIFKKG